MPKPFHKRHRSDHCWPVVGGAVAAIAAAIVALSAVALALGIRSDADAGAGATPPSIRVGYFPNLTQAPALVGIESGAFERALGDTATLRTASFNAGPEAIEALFADAIDAAFVGPGPAVNAYLRSGGTALRVVAGVTSGGASLVVRAGIDSAADLRGTTLATPQLGGTQDLALRTWLADNGLRTDINGGGDVAVVPQDNATTLTAFSTGTIDGAWLPEPWATRLIRSGGAHELVDERDLWPDGSFPTTVLIVSARYLDDHPAAVRRLLDGLIDTLDAISADPSAAQNQANDAIERVTQKRLDDAVVADAWPRLHFSTEPDPAAFATIAGRMAALGLLDGIDPDLVASIDELVDRVALDAALAFSSPAAPIDTTARPTEETNP